LFCPTNIFSVLSKAMGQAVAKPCEERSIQNKLASSRAGMSSHTLLSEQASKREVEFLQHKEQQEMRKAGIVGEISSAEVNITHLKEKKTCVSDECQQKEERQKLQKQFSKYVKDGEEREAWDRLKQAGENSHADNLQEQLAEVQRSLTAAEKSLERLNSELVSVEKDIASICKKEQDAKDAIMFHRQQVEEHKNHLMQDLDGFRERLENQVKAEADGMNTPKSSQSGIVLCFQGILSGHFKKKSDVLAEVIKELERLNVHSDSR